MNDQSAFIEHSEHIEDVCNNIDHWNPNIKLEILIVFEYKIADTMTDKTF